METKPECIYSVSPYNNDVESLRLNDPYHGVGHVFHPQFHPTGNYLQREKVMCIAFPKVTEDGTKEEPKWVSYLLILPRLLYLLGYFIKNSLHRST